MSVGATTQLDHVTRTLSTEPSSASERANAPRYEGRGAATEHGHVESHFLKANSPDGQRALWVRNTMLVPKSGPALAEVWAIAFAEGGRRKHAYKRTYPLAEATLTPVPFSFVLPTAQVRQGEATGTVGPEGALTWSLRFDAAQEPFMPFRYARMYSGAFPRSKTLTPVPDTRVHGEATVLGERWQLDGWRGAQGHNWGRSHAHAYAWCHANAWSREPEGAPLEETWIEALTGKVRLGRVVTPWLTVAGLCWQGKRFRFDGLSAMTTRQIAIDSRSYRFKLEQGGMQVAAFFHADDVQLAGLRYDDPDGQRLSCLNSKLASGVLTLSYRGQREVLHTTQAALELGTRLPDHGIEMLV